MNGTLRALWRPNRGAHSVQKVANGLSAANARQRSTRRAAPNPNVRVRGFHAFEALAPVLVRMCREWHACRAAASKRRGRARSKKLQTALVLHRPGSVALSPQLRIQMSVCCLAIINFAVAFVAGCVTRAHSMEQRFRLWETSAPQIGPAMMCAKPHWRLCRRKRLRGKNTKRTNFSTSRFDHLKTLHGAAATRTKSQ